MERYINDDLLDMNEEREELYVLNEDFDYDVADDMDPEHDDVWDDVL
jgi:hypothetical protein